MQSNEQIHNATRVVLLNHKRLVNDTSFAGCYARIDIYSYLIQSIGLLSQRVA